LWASAGIAQAATCPNEATREAQVSSALPTGTAYLPSCMALEMVSPPVKRQQSAFSATFSADGQRVKFRSPASLGETPGLQSLVDSYVATRTASGWEGASTSPPASAAIAGGISGGGPYAFAADLGHWDLLGATQAQLQAGSGQIFQGGLDGSFSALSPLLVPIDNSGATVLNFDTAGAVSSASSADLSTTVFRPKLTSSRYFAVDPAVDASEGELGSDRNTYLAFRDAGGEPSLELLARDKEGDVYGGRCGVRLGGGRSSLGAGLINQGAISADGQRIYFSTRSAQPSLGPCGASGFAKTTAGSSTLSGLLSAKGHGTLATGSVEVVGLSVEKGPFQPGQEIAGTGIPAGTKIVTVGQGGLTLSAAAGSSGSVALGASAFAAGQTINGTGIPAGTTILSTGALTATGETATLSAAATETHTTENGGFGSPVSALYPLRVFRRTATAAGPEIAPLIAGEGAAEWAQPGSDFYQGASVDGSRVYFTSSRALTAADHDASAQECSDEPGGSRGCDLYLYDFSKPPSERLIDVSAGTTGDPTPGEGADVLSSITAVSGDGTRAYFVAQGKLTSAKNPEGSEAQGGGPNLYLYDAATGSLSFVSTLAASDKGLLWGTEQSFVGGAYAAPSMGSSAAKGGDGHILVFDSHAPLTADDTDGGFSDVFRYDADTGTLQRISKAAPGGSESPAADVKVGPNGSAPNANPFEEGRWVSEDGDTIAFATAEPLAPGDLDGAANPYLWKEGQIARLPSTSVEGERLPTVSPTGNEVGFTTEDQLLPQDGDTAPDVYVARVDGGFPQAVAAILCSPLSEGSCRLPGEALVASVPASSSFSGAGNVRPAARCRSGFVRRHGRCVRRRHRDHGKKHRGKRHHNGTRKRR
jgi:hypothetical protein